MKTLRRTLAMLLFLATPLTAQDVELAPGESFTVRAMDSVTVVIDSIPYPDTVFVGDTTFACPEEWTCTPPPVDPPQMAVEADSAGLAVRWAAQPADSFWVYGARDDTGADEWDVILPGSDTSYHHALSYTQSTPMLTCVVAIRFDEHGQSCETVTWSPPAAPPEELPGVPGRPLFTALEDGRVRVDWEPAEHATSYTYWYSGHPESEGLTTPTNRVVLDDFENGGFFCTRGVNELGPAPGGTYRCNSYRPDPPPDPDPPPEANYPDRPSEPEQPTALSVDVGPYGDRITGAGVGLDWTDSCPIYPGPPGPDDPASVQLETGQWVLIAPCPPILQDAWRLRVTGPQELDRVVQSAVTTAYVALSEPGDYRACLQALFGPEPTQDTELGDYPQQSASTCRDFTFPHRAADEVTYMHRVELPPGTFTWGPADTLATVAAGQAVRLHVVRTDRCGWRPASADVCPGEPVPDSVVFSVGQERHLEQVLPFTFPGDEEMYTVPDTGALITWQAFGAGAQSGLYRIAVSESARVVP